MKYALPTIVLAAVFIAACTTDVNRRDLYRPAKADGPWTRSLEDGSWREGVQAVDAKRRTPAPTATPAPAIAAER